MCDRAANGQSDFPDSQQNIRTSRALSSTLAAAVRVASALSATSAVRQRVLSNDNTTENPITSNSSQEELTIDQCKDALPAVTSTPQKERNLDVIKISPKSSNEKGRSCESRKNNEKNDSDKNN